MISEISGILYGSALKADGTVLDYEYDEIVRIPGPERQEVLDWCYERDIDADLLWAGYGSDSYMSAWGIKNEQHRMMFALKWQ
jgi:hypothetical protein